MELQAFTRLREQFASAPEHEQIAASAKNGAGSDEPKYETRDGVAVIRFEGTVSKRSSWWSRGAVTTQARSALEAAMGDPAVKSVLLVIDSPGGTVSGTADLADAVFAARGKKPIVAYAEDLMASAAYWIGSQADRLVGNSTAAVGSIGVFAMLPDVSRLAKNLGIEVNIVKSAPGKGAGALGTAITDAQLADVKAEIDANHEEFVGAVARGRGLSKEAAAALADGRVKVGAEAVAAGLLDAIEPLSQVIAGLQVAAEPALQLVASTNPGHAPESESRTDVVAHVGAPKEDLLSETTPKAETPNDGVAEQLAKMNARFEAQDREIARLRSAADVNELVALARTERKITPGNEASLEPAIRATAEKSIDAGKALVAALPAIGPDGASVVDPQGTGAAAPGDGLPDVPRSTHDHVGGSLTAFLPSRGSVHQRAIAYQEKALVEGKKVSYREAVIATSRKSA
jgi:signal peptide peptidase SppA